MNKEIDLKKMKYFELKVVKVKKCGEIDYFCKIDKGDWCGKCPRRPIYKKGNWVNGENIDKIKFPVPCSYSKDNKKGLLSANLGYYYIVDIEKQEKNKNDAHLKKGCDLGNFIRENNIHILKGKIIIFEEE